MHGCTWSFQPIFIRTKKIYMDEKYPFTHESMCKVATNNLVKAIKKIIRKTMHQSPSAHCNSNEQANPIELNVHEPHEYIKFFLLISTN